VTRFAIEPDFELFIGTFQDRGGIAVCDMNGFASEVGGEDYAGEKNPQ
jgi:hypothetical protein